MRLGSEGRINQLWEGRKEGLKKGIHQFCFSVVVLNRASMICSFLDKPQFMSRIMVSGEVHNQRHGAVHDEAHPEAAVRTGRAAAGEESLIILKSL